VPSSPGPRGSMVAGGSCSLLGPLWVALVFGVSVEARPSMEAWQPPKLDREPLPPWAGGPWAPQPTPALSLPSALRRHASCKLGDEDAETVTGSAEDLLADCARQRAGEEATGLVAEFHAVYLDLVALSRPDDRVDPDDSSQASDQLDDRIQKKQLRPVSFKLLEHPGGRVLSTRLPVDAAATTARAAQWSPQALQIPGSVGEASQLRRRLAPSLRAVRFGVTASTT